MKRFVITYVDRKGKTWPVAEFEAVSMKAAAQMFWGMWTSHIMPKSFSIVEKE